MPLDKSGRLEHKPGVFTDMPIQSDGTMRMISLAGKSSSSIKSLFAHKTLNCFQKKSSLQKYSHQLLPKVNHEELVSRLKLSMSIEEGEF